MRKEAAILVADVGGTKTRLALGRGVRLGKIKSLFNDGVPDLQELLARELAAAGKNRPATAVLAVAAPIDGDHVALTNRAWSFSQAKLKRALKLRRLIVVNDFAAVAHALPVLKAKDLVRVGGGKGKKDGNLVACGPGTGFGVAALVRNERAPFVLPSEAGHMLFAPAAADEAEIFARLSGPKPLVVENLLSGPGIARLHRALSGQALTSDQVITNAKAGHEEALRTVEIFLRLLGRVAGDIALAFDARGGVYIAGGVGRALAGLFAKSPFRKAFEDHPTYGERLAAIPTYAIVHPSPELLGALTLALAEIRG
ncbi:MAG TPA: ROK family protein [Xanthobacteraceae bacterium]|nr:ROK family protein [Xanthobacteraceae bacterium]